MSELRAIIREMLERELSSIKTKLTEPDIRRETVSINSNEELASFVSQLLSRLDTDDFKNQVLNGQHVFELAPNEKIKQSTVPATQQSLAATSEALEIESGLVTEKDVTKLPADLNLINVGETVRFTPLARDELRRRRIKIQRRTS